MRILGYIDDPKLKITVFADNGKIIVQAQDTYSQLSYKFREGSVVHDIQSVKALMDESALDNIRKQLAQQEAERVRLIQEALKKAEDEFDEII